MSGQWSLAVWTEGTVEEEGVIPSVWINDQTVRWPPMGSNAVKLMKFLQIPTPDWRKFPLVKIKTTSDLRSACEQYNETTEIEGTSDSEEEALPSSRRRKRKLYTDCIMGDIPLRKEKRSAINEPSESGDSELEVMPVPDVPEEEMNYLNAKKCQKEHSSDDTEELNTSSVDELCESPVPDISTTPTNLNGGPSAKTPMSQLRFQRKVFFMLQNIMQKIDGIGRNHLPQTDPFHLEKIDNIEGLKTIEFQIENEKQRNLLRQQLKLIGGNTARDNVNQILNRMFTNSFMARMNVQGGHGKVAFSKSPLFKVILEAVRELHPNVLETAYTKDVGDYLKHAPARKGGRSTSNSSSPA